MNMTIAVKKLEKWLEKKENSKPKLAAKLEYDSSNVIDQWLVRRRIPADKLYKVLEIIDGDVRQGDKGQKRQTN